MRRAVAAAGVVAVAAVAVAAVVLGGGGGVEARLRQRALREMEEHLGGDVDLERVRVSGPRDVALEGLRWRPAAGAVEELTVAELRLAVDPVALLDGEARIGGITVVGPSVLLAPHRVAPAVAGVAGADAAIPGGSAPLADARSATDAGEGAPAWTGALRRALTASATPLSGRPAEVLERALAVLDGDGVFALQDGVVRGLPGGLEVSGINGVVLVAADEGALSLDAAGVVDAGGTVSLRATAAAERPVEGRVEIEGVPLDLLAAAVPWPDGVDVRGGTVDLTLGSEPDAGGGGPRWTFSLAVDGATARLPQLPGLPWPLTTRHLMRVTPRSGGQRLEIDDWRWTVNGVPGTGSLTLVHLGERPELRAVVSLDDVPYQDLLDALPRGTVPEAWGLTLGGTLDLTLRVGGPLDDRSSWDLGWKGDWSRLQLAPGAIGERVVAMRDAFPYTIDGPGDDPIRRVMGPQDPHFIALELVQPDLPAAVVVCEDAAFYKHHGFDQQELRQALLENVREGAGRGGSTVTQQVVKNLFLTGERTWTRKVREALLTAYLERLLDKRRILEIYLNLAELGPGIYGVRDAAYHYFGRSTAQLTTMECVFLATLLPSPVRYHDYYHPRGAVTSRWDEHMHQVLDRMRSQGYLTDGEHAVAAHQILRFAPCTGGGA